MPDIIHSVVNIAGGPALYTIGCKICDCVIDKTENRSNYIYSPELLLECNLSAVRHHISRHKILLTHYEEKIHIYCNSSSIFYINIQIAGGASRWLEWQAIYKHMEQILFMNCDTSKLLEIHEKLYEKCKAESNYKHLNSSIFLYYYEKEIFYLDYACLYCGDEYESGLPAKEIVIEHLKLCNGLCN